MTADKGRRLGALARDLSQAADGSILATDSPRTPVRAGDAMQSELGEHSYCYRFHARGTEGENNPYLGLLAVADAFIVTGESMSMLAEATATGRPVFVFDVGDGDTPWWALSHNYRYKPLSFRLGMALGPRRMRRDIDRIQQALVSGGQANWLNDSTVYQQAEKLSRGQGDQPAVQGGMGTVAAADLANAVAAVRRLVTPN